MSYLRVEGTKLVRDTRSGAIINQDKNGLDEYLNKRRVLESQKNEINNVKSEVKELREDITEIKSLLLKLLEKG
jgi:predicted transcriptional regulator